MNTNIVAIDKTIHKDIKIKHDGAYTRAKNQHFAVLQVHEFIAAAANFPIVFIKDTETGELRPIAMFGLQDSENLYYDEKGWKADYVPLTLRSHPFALAPQSPNSDLLTLCIDTNSICVSKDQGESLFNTDGSETEYFKQVKNFLSNLIGQTPVTEEFTKYLVSKNLVQSFSFSITKEKDGLEPYSVSGIYAVDNKALNALSDSEFLELRKKGYLPAIYAHLMSLGLVSALAQKKATLK